MCHENFASLSFMCHTGKSHKELNQTHDFQKGKLVWDFQLSIKGQNQDQISEPRSWQTCFCSHRAVFINHKILKYTSTLWGSDWSQFSLYRGNGHLLEPWDKWESNLENEEEPKANSLYLERRKRKWPGLGYDGRERRSQQAPLSLRRT